MTLRRKRAGGPLMPDYRLYCIDGAGRFIRSREFSAASDEEAIEIARAMKLPDRCELWQRSRMVIDLPAHPA